ncbi:hypothetical protein GTU79_29190 [Sodalis ligni]|uniref:hypothetical protein n=1 Tax=Sodalis ligni TaxID=2697027 RepID=UPI001BDDE3F2|nr:hypothetical protein [Sodalis ligni]QWA11140.1 hypothetical protein GTU79_29190 [Sodalis ligni]
MGELKRLNHDIRTHGHDGVYDNYSDLISMNAEFHKVIVNAAGNSLINDMYTALDFGPQLFISRRTGSA